LPRAAGQGVCAGIMMVGSVATFGVPGQIIGTAMRTWGPCWLRRARSVASMCLSGSPRSRKVGGGATARTKRTDKTVVPW